MFRKESERYIFSKSGDKISFDSVMSYLGKTIPVCLYSNRNTDIIKVPLDFNSQNILPSNMDYVSKSLVQNKDVDLAIATIKCQQFEISLYGPSYVIDRHIKLIPEAIKLNDNDLDTIIRRPIEAIYAMWDALMFNNIKGIFEIKMTSNDVTYSIESQMMIGKLLSKMKEREKLSSPLKLV